MINFRGMFTGAALDWAETKLRSNRFRIKELEEALHEAKVKARFAELELESLRSLYHKHTKLITELKRERDDLRDALKPFVVLRGVLDTNEDNWLPTSIAVRDVIRAMAVLENDYEAE